MGEKQSINRNEGKQKAGQFVYFLMTDDERIIKIGYSTNIPQRIDHLRQKCRDKFGCDLHLLGAFPGTFHTEAWVHSKFHHLRVHGDWYRNSGELPDFIKALGLLPADFIRASRPRRSMKTWTPMSQSPTQSPVDDWVWNRTPKNPHAAALGKLGGAKGGKARWSRLSPTERKRTARRTAQVMANGRMAAMTPDQRTGISKNAAKSRWSSRQESKIK